MNTIKNKIEKSYPLIRIDGKDNQKTLYFNIDKKEINAGQFYMLNYNGCQKPISVSHYNDNIIGFTIQNRGECSVKMINAQIGEHFGLTGPLGSSFDIENHKKFLLIGGGIGTAPIFFLANNLIKYNKEFDILFGARNYEFLEYTKVLKDQIKYFTDDGSFGEKGFVTDGIEYLLKENKYDTVCICGPEKMMKITLSKLIQTINNIQISMERYMKCGIGLCGSCVLDDIGLRVCEDGPVFSYDILSKSKEFANYHRDSSGIIVNI